MPNVRVIFCDVLFVNVMQFCQELNIKEEYEEEKRKKKKKKT